MLILAVSQVEGGFFSASNGGSNNPQDGFFITINGFMHSVTIPCYPSWTWRLSECHNNSRYKEYYDIYSCDLTDGFPSDNSTYMVDCTAQKVENMEVIAIAILMIGFLFFLIYVANTLPSRTDRNDPIRFNIMLKTILYSSSALVGFFALQMAYGISTAYGLSQAIESNISAIYQYIIYIGYIIGILFLVGIIWSIYMWISEMIQSIGRR